MLKLCRIASPAWAEPTTTERSARFPVEDYSAIQRVRSDVEVAAHQAIEAYFDDIKVDSLFPEIDRLTGKYYLSSEHYYISDQPWFAKVGRVRSMNFYFLYHFTEVSRFRAPEEEDYLGLSILFEWNPTTAAFFWKATDSSSI